MIEEHPHFFCALFLFSLLLTFQEIYHTQNILLSFKYILILKVFLFKEIYNLKKRLSESFIIGLCCQTFSHKLAKPKRKGKVKSLLSHLIILPYQLTTYHYFLSSWVNPTATQLLLLLLLLFCCAFLLHLLFFK